MLILGAAAVSGLLIALAAADAAGQTVHSPIRPPGLWHWAWVGGIAAAFAAYAAGVFRLRGRQVALRPILLIAVVMQLAPLSGPLLLSTDVFGYWSFGRLEAVHHVNPYVTAPSAVMSPDELRYGQGQTATVYGPAFTAASEIQARLAGGSEREIEVVYRVAAALGVLALLAIVAVCLERPAFAVAFIGWSPLFALHFAGGGHNDVWMLVFAVAGILLARRMRAAAAGSAWAIAALIKAPALVFLPLEVIALVRRGGRGPGWRFAGGFAAAAGILGALATVRYGTAWLPFGQTAKETQGTSSLSLVSRLVQAGVPRSVAKPALLGLGVLGYLCLTRDAWHGRARLGLAAAFVIAAPAWLVPWYGSWPVAFAALEDDLAAQVVAAVATAYLLTDALPF